MQRVLCVLVAGLVAAPFSAAAQTRNEAMNRLASERGCALCHGDRSSRARGEGVLPTGPAWQEIARRYKDRPGAEDILVEVVLHGSGAGPKGRHWAGKTSGVEMPANTVEITEAEARDLVRWILRR
jgi:cytochrome c